MPNTVYYEEFTQFENGIGMLPLFMEEFRLALPDYEGRAARRLPLRPARPPRLLWRSCLTRRPQNAII